MPPNLACTHGPATGTFPARDSPGNWGENRQIFSKSLLQHFSEAQQGSPAAHRTGEQAAAMRARQPRGKDGHSPLRLLPPRFGMVSHPMGHGSTLSPAGPAAGRAFQRGHPQPCFTMAKGIPEGGRETYGQAPCANCQRLGHGKMCARRLPRPIWDRHSGVVRIAPKPPLSAGAGVAEAL